MKNYQFESHDEIPFILRNYLMTVAEVSVFNEIPLFDVNSFLNGLEEFHGKSVDSDVIHKELNAPSCFV
jgi:hypothetical protein